MKEKIYYRGTLIEFYNKSSYNHGIEKFILAECREKDYIFQIISLSAYEAGRLSGYIKEDEEMKNQKKRAITYKHLIEELNRNFGEFDLNSLRIED